MQGRPLTLGEWSALSPGLAKALEEAGARPQVVPAAHPGAMVAGLWRGGAPVLTRGDKIFWPGAGDDFAKPGHDKAMSILQHELQHVLEYAQGQLSAATYLTGPHNWSYDYKLTPGCAWTDFGAEQRASIVEDLFWLERGGDGVKLAAYRGLIPWAHPKAPTAET
jgi:hypothetical protein